MNTLPSGEFAFALIFGAVVVWFHAWNQFNRPSYEHSPEFARLISKLQPSDLRKGGIYIRAFLFYAAILTIVYLVICVFLTVPAFQSIASAIPGLSLLDGTAGAAQLPEQVASPVAGVAFDEAGGLGTLGSVDPASGASPSIPLAVSLAVVGLAPNVPVLYQIEEFVRVTAHRLSGIPTRLVSSGLELRSDPILPATARAGLLLPLSDWNRLAAYAAAAAGAVEFPDRFDADIRKVVALRRWILEGAIWLPDSTVRASYVPIETEVRTRIGALIRDLDDASGYAEGPPRPGARPAAAEPAAPGRDWPGLLRETEETAADLCLLVVLYSEHRAFKAAVRPSQLDGQGDDAARVAAERTQATDLLAAALRRATASGDEDTVGSMLFFRLAGMILMVVALAGVVLGGFGLGGAGVFGTLGRVATLAASAVVTYVPALFFALSYQQAAIRDDGWTNAFDAVGKPSRFVPQLVFVFAVAVVVALLSRLAYHLYFIVAQTPNGLQVVRENWRQVIDFAVRIELVYAVLGGVLALATLLIVDAWRAGRLPATRWVFVAALPAALGAVAILGYFNVQALYQAARSWPTLVLEVVPPVAVGLLAALYAIRSLYDEFPAVFANGVDGARA